MHATLWHGDAVVDLGTLGGAYSYAHDINNLGQIVGQSSLNDGAYVATLWQTGAGARANALLKATGPSATALGTLGGSSSSATGINDQGQVVGWSLGSDESSLRGFTWHTGSMSDLNKGSMRESHADKINNAGMVVGSSRQVDSGDRHATLWRGPDAAADLGTLAFGTYSYAYDVSDTGLVVGMSASWGDTVRRATIWNGQEQTDLGTLGGDDSYAAAINEKGWIVGSSQADVADPSWHAALWRDGQVIDLNSYLEPDSQWVLQTATDINENGWIIGKALNKTTGLTQGYMLMAPVPEPETYGLFIVGLGVVAASKWRRRPVRA